jgi:hypothetical protein
VLNQSHLQQCRIHPPEASGLRRRLHRDHVSVPKDDTMNSLLVVHAASCTDGNL